MNAETLQRLLEWLRGEVPVPRWNIVGTLLILGLFVVRWILMG